VSRYALSHLSDAALSQDLSTLVARERTATAELLAHIAEVDDRRLYLPAGHPSMCSYGVHELLCSEDAAYKRIQAARAARRFPALFPALAEGWLHLSAVVLLAPHLTAENVEELLLAAALKTKAGIETLPAARFPRPDLPQRIEALAAPAPTGGLLSPGPSLPDPQLAPRRMEAPGRSRVGPRSAGRFGLQLTLGRSAHEKLCYAQALLGHPSPAGTWRGCSSTPWTP
jgi:hypothetical protein